VRRSGFLASVIATLLVKSDMNTHLAHLALSDMNARREYARELTRRGDLRGRLLEYSIEPGRRAWREIHAILEGEDTLVDWLSPFLDHWTKLECFGVERLVNVTPITCFRYLRTLDLGVGSLSLCDIAPLAVLRHLEHLNLNYSRVSNLEPLSGLLNLQSLHLFQTQVSDLSPLASLINLQEIRLHP